MLIMAPRSANFKFENRLISSNSPPSILVFFHYTGFQGKSKMGGDGEFLLIQQIFDWNMIEYKVIIILERVFHDP